MRRLIAWRHGESANVTGRFDATTWLSSLALFAIALTVRWWFFAGFVLCDDIEELGLIERLTAMPPDFRGHLQYRVPLWWFNVLSIRVLGLSELAFFLPTVLISATLPPVAFLILMTRRGDRIQAFLIGLVVATAPFEVLIGTLRANDLFLAWFLSLAALALVALTRHPRTQGGAVAVLLWCAFYAKLWAVYVIAPVAGYYVWAALRRRCVRGALAFLVVSIFLHGTTTIYWKWSVGVFLPFLRWRSAAYLTPASAIPHLLRQYPSQVFHGSEFGTTLFGIIPWVAVSLLLAKIVCTVVGGRTRRLFGIDYLDILLGSWYVSFFVLLEFVPNGLALDGYYSAPRIFRYLTPISFPMAMHVGKMLLDCCRLAGWGVPATLVVFAAVVSVNLWQTGEATRPGRASRAALVALREDVRNACAPRIVMDTWQAALFNRVYLRGSCAQGTTVALPAIFQAHEYEQWLRDGEDELPDGTLLVSGFASCVHYGCHTCGIRLRHFQQVIGPRWTLVKQYGTLDYLARPEPVALWRLANRSVPGDTPPSPGGVSDPVSDYADGLRLFDQGQTREARQRFGAVLRSPTSSVTEDARYFYAVTYWREGDHPATVREFSRLLSDDPGSRWIAGAHYHIGLALKGMGDFEGARTHFEVILENHSGDAVLTGYARTEVDSIPPVSLLARIRTWWRGRNRPPSRGSTLPYGTRADPR